MARRQLDALLGDEVDERVVRRRRGVVHRRHHALEGLRAGDRRDIGKGVADRVGLGAHAAGDDHLAVLVHRRADRGERFRLGAVEKAAGVDDDGVGAGVAARELVAFGAQLREDPLAVDERLRAAERNEGNARRAARLGGSGVGRGSTESVIASDCHGPQGRAGRLGLLLRHIPIGSRNRANMGKRLRLSVAKGSRASRS